MSLRGYVRYEVNTGDLVGIMMPQGKWASRHDQHGDPIWEKWDPAPVFGIVTHTGADEVTVRVHDLTGAAGNPPSMSLDRKYVTLVMPKAFLDVIPWAPEPVWEDTDCGYPRDPD
jgi:hypothetical protein